MTDGSAPGIGTREGQGEHQKGGDIDTEEDVCLIAPKQTLRKRFESE